MNRTSSKTFQILSLSGGGYRGLHIAQILEIIEEKINGSIAKHFDLIAGTSIGGIIGLALSLEIPAKDIRKTLEDLGPSLFPRTPPDFSTARKVLARSGLMKLLLACKYWNDLAAEEKYTRSAWYDPKPLYEALSAPHYFGKKLIRDLSHPVIIPAVNYSSGSPQFFKTDHHKSLNFDCDLPIIDVALGTAAAPIYFPVHKIKDWRIVDGGLIANDPTQVAVHEAMKFFGIRPPLYGDPATGSDDLRVLSIGTLAPKHFADITKPLNQGMLDWGTSVFDLAGCAQEAMSAHMVSHMLPNKVIRLPSLEGRPEKAPGLADASAASTEFLRGSARRLAQSAFGQDDFMQLFTHTGRSLLEVRADISKDMK